MEETSKKEGGWPVQPVQLTGKSRFCFSCGPEVACFTKCCHGMEIILAPYDILRLKRRLGLTSSEFLLKHTTPTQHEESSLPLVLLKMGDEKEKSCPFLTDKGCSVYEDRPSICRYKDQGADSDDEINRDWQAAFLSRSIPGQERSEPQRQSLFYMTCYDLDTFRRFVLESPFLEKFEVDDETVEKIRKDDEELLRFALRYMKYVMMMEETMTPKEGVVDTWRAKKTEENN
jgi:Fe-S-cluster containining protein